MKPWRIRVPEARGMAHDPARDEIALTTGTVVSTKDGSTVCDLAPLAGCSSVAVFPGTGFIGVSAHGMISVWQESEV